MDFGILSRKCKQTIIHLTRIEVDGKSPEHLVCGILCASQDHLQSNSHLIPQKAKHAKRFYSQFLNNLLIYESIIPF